MEIKPYYTETAKKAQIEKMFDSIAPNYDLLNKVLSLGIDRLWRKNAIKMIQNRSASVVLDVATGTGDLALEIEKQISPNKIMGIDLAEGMLKIGREKIESKGLSDVIQLVQADSESLPFPDNSFDVVTAAFGVRNFENLDVGLREMNRVLKKGGQLVILEFTKPRYFPFKQLFNIYFKNILPVIGKIKSKDPRAYQYLYESVQAFPDYEGLNKSLAANGFTDCQWSSLSLGICAVYSAFK